MAINQPDPLNERARRDRVQLEDLSALECEALRLLREDEFRMLSAMMMRHDVSDMLRTHALSTKQALLSKGLAERAPAFLSYVRLTAEGVRLQAELFAEDAHA